MFWEANGYLAVPNALSPDQLARVRAAADRAEAKWRGDPKLPGNRGPALEQVLGPIEYEDELLALLEHPVTFPIVRELLGEDVSMVDNDLFITPVRQTTHANWHHDEWLPGVHHPGSTMMVKVFFLLSDVPSDGGGTAVVPGSYRFPVDMKMPTVDDPKKMPGMVRLAFPAGTAYLFHGHTYHAALNNESDVVRKVLIYNYGHFYMKPWQGYEPSEKVRAKATTPVMKQLLHLGTNYGQRLS
jgi:ectoine hydroxylase-related dioxygenase (phytanoyl-CoA dioxygenase family)